MVLDFGPGAFTGDARWLEIGVRPGASTGAYTPLTPRQPLTAAPYALALPGLWTQPNSTSPNLIGGYSGNSVTSGASGATIGGGGASGNTNRVTDNYATVGGGSFNTASGSHATVPGGFGAAATHYGEMAYASGAFAASGDAQTSVYVLRGTSSGTTLTELFLDGSGSRLTIAPGRTLTFDILVVGRSATGESAGYQIRGVIKNVGGTTAIVGSVSKTDLAEDDATWDVTVDADDATDALRIRVQGGAGGSVRWVATVRTVEVSW